MSDDLTGLHGSEIMISSSFECKLDAEVNKNYFATGYPIQPVGDVS